MLLLLNLIPAAIQKEQVCSTAYNIGQFLVLLEDPDGPMFDGPGDPRPLGRAGSRCAPEMVHLEGTPLLDVQH